MPVSGEWANDEKTVYRLTFTGKWTIAEVSAAGDEYTRVVAQVSHPVVSFVDMRGSRVAPSGNLLDIGILGFRDPIPNEDLIVILTGSRLFRETGTVFIGLLRKMFPDRLMNIVWARTEAEAHRLINQHWRDNPPHGKG